eukprot:836439-Amphidinium_carterae.1
MPVTVYELKFAKRTTSPQCVGPRTESTDCSHKAAPRSTHFLTRRCCGSCIWAQILKKVIDDCVVSLRHMLANELRGMSVTVGAWEVIARVTMGSANNHLFTEHAPNGRTSQTILNV